MTARRYRCVDRTDRADRAVHRAPAALPLVLRAHALHHHPHLPRLRGLHGRWPPRGRIVRCVVVLAWPFADPRRRSDLRHDLPASAALRHSLRGLCTSLTRSHRTYARRNSASARSRSTPSTWTSTAALATSSTSPRSPPRTSSRRSVACSVSQLTHPDLELAVLNGCLVGSVGFCIDMQFIWDYRRIQ